MGKIKMISQTQTYWDQSPCWGTFPRWSHLRPSQRPWSFCDLACRLCCCPREPSSRWPHPSLPASPSPFQSHHQFGWFACPLGCTSAGRAVSFPLRGEELCRILPPLFASPHSFHPEKGWQPWQCTLHIAHLPSWRVLELLKEEVEFQKNIIAIKTFVSLSTLCCHFYLELSPRGWLLDEDFDGHCMVSFECLKEKKDVSFWNKRPK